MQQKRRKIFIAKIIAFCAIFSALSGGIIYLGHASFFSVSKIDVLGASAVSADALVKTADSVTNGSKFFLFSKKNTFFLSKAEIEEKILNEFPRVNDVSVTRKGLTGIDIAITERNSSYIWCVNKDMGSCYFLDSLGYIFDKAPDNSNNSNFVIYGPLGDSPIGENALSKETVSYITSLKDAIANLGLSVGTPVSLVIKAPEDYAFTFENGFQLFFDTDEPVNIVIENIRLAIDQGGVRDKLASLSYIDARFGNKIFFK